MATPFSFTAPYPALKHRRVSLALPASTPRVPWDFRDDTGIAGPSNPQQQTALPPGPSKETIKAKTRKSEPQDPSAPLPEKKPRKKWSPEETQMLVEGCNRHGVGNWKTILSDPELKFDSRSPVDLKDRFRTYFPDAYKKHYPNARTHLSSKVRSTLPDGSSLFEKTRSKRRRPFTEEEDRALKAGYEKHGTVWATIVKDPIFQEQNRRSTDLRDRFRNAFPELYQAAGYKPRNNASKKKKEHSIEDSRRLSGRSATDDQLALSSSGTTGPVRGVRRRRAQTSQGILLRGGTKSVPQSTAPSEDEDSSQEDEDGEMSSSANLGNLPKTPVFTDQPSMAVEGIKNLHLFSPATNVEATFPTVLEDDDDGMGMRLITLDPLASDPLAEYPSSSSTLDNHAQQQQQQHSSAPRHSGIDTPTRTHHPAWSSSQSGAHNAVNDGGGGGNNPSGSPSATNNNNPHPQPQIQTGHAGLKVGQSAWGPQDWLSPNPRLDPSSNSPTNANGSSTPGTGTPSSYFSPSSPFTSFNLPPLNATHPLAPSNATTTGQNPTATQHNGNNGSATTAASAANPNSLVGNLTTTLTTLNLPISHMTNFYSSHQHYGVIERYDLWPPSSSALAQSSAFSAVNNSSAWSSALSGSGGGPFSGPGSISGFGSSFAADWDSDVSFDNHSQTFSDDRDHDDGVFGADGTYSSLGYGGVTTNATGNGGTLSANRAITHHSDFAGDLIFGARGYGIGGGFGWFANGYGPNGTSVPDDDPHANSADGATGLGLVGITKDEKRGGEGDERVGEGGGDNNAVVVPGDGKGSINPMQLHASSTGPMVDEAPLARITLNDSQDVDSEMSDAAMEDDDAMDGSRASSLKPGQGKTPSPDKQQQRQNIVGKSNSAHASPLQSRRATLGHMPSPIPHSPHHQHLPHPHVQPPPQPHFHHLPQHSPHTPSHNHSLSLSLSPPNAFSSSSGSTSVSTPGANTYGKFSLDDLVLVDFNQQNPLVDNNLTPPATPVMQHATQLRGARRYPVHGLGLGTSGGLGGGLFMPGTGHGQSSGQPSQQVQGQSARSTSVPPSEARNANESFGIPFTPLNPAPTSHSGSNETVERGRTRTLQASDVHAVKRSLSSTVHHSHGPSTHHGHSLSLSTLAPLPPLPSHQEIWRSTTPVAKTSSTGGGSSTSSNATSPTSSTPSTANANNTPGGTASLFSNLFQSSSSPFSGASFSSSTGGAGVHVNPEAYTNADLSFLDLHYFNHQNQQQQLQHGFGAMLVDTPATTPGLPSLSGNSGAPMTQAEVEARQALDLAQPFYFHHGHGPQPLGQLHALAQNQNQQQGQAQSSGFGFAGGNTSTSGGSSGLKGLGGNLFNTPVNLARQLSQFSVAAATTRSQHQQQQPGHQRVQSQQVVNPKDLVLNAEGLGSMSDSGSRDATLRLDSRKKRASWDGGVM